jgi:hypothetical protein
MAVSRMLSTALLILLTASGESATTVEPDSKPGTIDSFIDQLAEIDAPAAGLHPTLFDATFLADGSPDAIEGGVFGSQAPKRFPQMVELVRRGLDALPALVEHLGDRRDTKLVVGNTFFMFREFSDEYDPKVRTASRGGGIASLSHIGDEQAAFRAMFDHSFEGTYTVKVGDVCYALIGQIVNRRFYAVRYQPSAGLVVSSPIESPILIEAVRKDWGDTDASALKRSFLADAESDTKYFYEPALQHLKFYFPDEYQKQSVAGELAEKIRAFEIKVRKSQSRR